MTINNRTHGITLVELLVVITIVTVITALIIPRIRMVNKDRNIREAARVVGSIFSTASNNAISEGVAGVLIQRNPNFIETTDPPNANNSVYFAGTRLYLMRAIPDYTGDAIGQKASVFVDNSSLIPRLRCTIALPLDHVPASGVEVVRQNDQIRFGGNSVRYLINSIPIIDLNNQTLTFDLQYDDDNDPNNPFDFTRPNLFTGTPAPRLGESTFVVERQPRIIESSAVELPAGYVIDLRYSGPLDLDDIDQNTSTYTGCGLTNDYNAPPNYDPSRPSNDLVALFDRSGGINRIEFNNRSVVFGQSLFLYITEYDPNTVDVSGNVPAFETALQALSKPEALWVTVNSATGGVGISYNTPPPPNVATAFDAISAARSISRGRTNAAQ